MAKQTIVEAATIKMTQLSSPKSAANPLQQQLLLAAAAAT